MTTAPLFTAKTPPGFYAAQAPSPYAAGTPPLGPSPESGAIAGGLLRPGSIDQTTFLQMLQQQQQNRAAAGVGGKAVPMPVQGIQGTAAPNVPTLSSAQFAALVGAQNADQGLAAAPQEGLAADPRGMAAAQAQLQAQAMVQAQLMAGKATAPQGPALKLSGSANRNLFANPPAGPAPASAEADPDLPTISRKSQPQQTAALDAAAVESPAAGDAPSITRSSAPVLEASAGADAAPAEGEAESETAAKGDPNVVHLKSPPDKEQIAELRMRNKRWVVDETPGARQLFFGADGEFGWDDFVDMINPLQHIPGIAQIYRAVTGDEINGAASLLGALPLGPLGGLGMVATVVDLAVKDTTGDDMGGNVMAMVFGRDGKPQDGGAAPADMADSGTTGKATTTATSRQTAFAMSEASELHASCRG
ncbi:hypothetical protein [Dongia sp.]|uniref:hypothetical protein n=1 Tax=Dongia sp. TaxID=1977262 RepID=UPI0037503071